MAVMRLALFCRTSQAWALQIFVVAAVAGFWCGGVVRGRVFMRACGGDRN